MSTEKTTRAITSASNWFRRVLCPGSEAAELNAPEEDSSAAAALGTELHYYDATGEEAEDISKRELVERNRAIREAYFRQQLEQLCIPENAVRLVITEQKDMEYFVRDEEGQLLLGIDGKPFGGHPDRLEYFPEYKVLFIFDSKFGRKRVPAAESNEQLKVYTIATADEFGDFDAERVYVAITQPMAYPQVHAAYYDKALIEEHKKELLRNWREIKKPLQPRNPSLEACFYCRARATCPEALALVKKLSAVKVGETPVEELEALVPTIELVEVIAKQFWNRLKYIAKSYPHLLQKHELSKGSEIRELQADKVPEAYSRLIEAGLIDPANFVKACRVTFTRLDELVAEHLNIPTKEARFRVDTVLNGVITMKPKGATIVERKEQKMISAAPESSVESRNRTSEHGEGLLVH